jgi:hypothetical protein
MAKKASGERERFWRDLIERQPASGMSIAQFCKQSGVSANSYFVWKRRLRRQIGEPERGHRASRPRRNSGEGSSHRKAHPVGKSFVPVRLIADPVHRHAPHAAAIEVEWPNGLVLRVPTDCDGRVVRDVVEALAPLLVGDGASC